MINTGMPRSVLGHWVSGSIASLIVSGAINYKRVEEGKMSTKEAGVDTLKKTLQGGTVTASAIAVANHIGTPAGYFKALASLSVGAACVYAIEKGADLLLDDSPKLITE